jgi:hypothetical protein
MTLKICLSLLLFIFSNESLSLNNLTKVIGGIMGKVKDWLIKYPVNLEINHLLEKKGKDYKPQDYYLNIIGKVDIVNFESTFEDFKTLYPTVNHNDLIGRLGLLNIHLIDDDFELIRQKDKNGDLDHQDKNTCFIYFFTVEEAFKTGDEDLIKKFKEKYDGSPIGPKQFKHSEEFIGEDGEKYIVYEKLVYVGMTTDISSRFKAHEVFRKLHQKRFINASKYIYIAEIEIGEEILYEDLPGTGEKELTLWTPLDVVSPIKLVTNILNFLESMLICFFEAPEFNKLHSTPKIFFYTDEKLDPWGKIIVPDYIKIEESTTIQSIFFNKEYALNKEKQKELLERVTEKELILYSKSTGLDN